MTRHDEGGEATGRLPRLWRRICGGIAGPTDSDSTGRGRLLSGLLLLLLAWGITWPFFLRLRLLPEAGWTHPEILVSFGFAVGVVVAARLNRRGCYLPAAALTVGLLFSGVFASLHLTLSGAMEPVFSRNDPGLLSYIVLPVVLGAVLLPPRLLLAFLVCALGGVLAVPFVYPHVSLDAVLYGPLLYLAVVCGLLLFVSFLVSGEQRRTLAELQEREERFRGLFEQSPDTVLVVAADGDIRAVNPAGAALLGYAAEELVGKRASVIYASPGDRDAVIAKAERQGYLHEEPVRLRTKGGAILECLSTMLPRRDAAGRTLEYQTVVRDVTARKRAEEELQLRGQLLEVERDAIMLVEPGGQVLYANQASEELTGYTAAELVGMNIRQFNTPEGAERLPEVFGAGLRDGAIELASTGIRKDGSRMDVEVRGQVFESRGRKLFLSVIRDVTARKAVEAELRLRGQLLDLANDAVILHDLRGRFLYVNEAAAVQRGYTREELMGMTLRALEDEETAALFSEHVSELMNSRCVSFEGGHRRKDGTVFPVEVRSQMVDWGDTSVALSVIRDISERKRAEQVLKAERDRAQGYLDVAAVMLVVMDADGNIALLNRRGAEMLGADEADLIGRSWIDTCVPEEQRDYVRSVFAGFMSGRADIREHVVNDIVTPSGKRRTIAWHNALLRDASGRPSGTLSSGEDVTERLATERALKLSEERFRALYEQAIDAIFENEPDGSGVQANRAWMDLFGYAPEELATMNAVDLYVDPQDRESYVRGLQETGSVRDEVWLKRKDGTRVLCQRVASARRDASGKVVAYQGVVRDITALREAERALRESEEKYRLLFQRSLDAIYINTPEGKSIEANQAWLDMFGYTREELPGLDSVSMYADPRDREDFLRQIRQDGFVVGEARFKRKDGTLCDGQRSVVALRDESGIIVRFVGIMRDITATKRAEQQLRESEAKYHELFDKSMDAVALVSVDGTLLDANPAYLKLFGHTANVIGRKVSHTHYSNPADRDEMLRLLERDGVIVDQEARLRKADGTEMDCIRSIVARRDSQGRLVEFQSVARDITGRKRAEQALADELTRRRILVEQSRDGIVVLDEDGKAVETNRKFAEMLGYTREEVLQLHVSDWDVPTPPERLKEMIRDVDESGDHFETQHRRKDGSVYDVEISTNAAVFSGRKLIFCVCRDISARKRAEQALRESELRFRALVEHTGLGMTMTRTDGGFIDANEVFLQMTGYGREELERLRVPDVYARREDRERALAQVVRDGYIRGEELEFRRKDGSPLFVSLTAALVPRGGQTVVISEFLDITQRRAVEEELRRSEEDLRRLATRLEEAREAERTGIARELHDQLGQALTALKLDLGRVWRAQEQHSDVPPEMLGRMMKLLDDTMNDVRRISSELRPGMLDDVGLVATMEWQLAQFGERTGIKCRFAAAADDAAVDRSRSTALFRILQELLTNVARHANAKNVTVGFEREDGSYVLTVADDGVGITPEQASSPSSLGLIGMRERVRPFGGSVEISGKKGDGTKVRVVLPAA